MPTANSYRFELLRSSSQKVLNVPLRVCFRAFCLLRLESLRAMSFRDAIGFVRRSLAALDLLLDDFLFLGIA